MVNKLSIGKRSEYVVLAKLLRAGIDVFPALVDDKGIDAIMGFNGKYFELQIKSGASWSTPRGLRKEIFLKHRKRVFVIHNYTTDEERFFTGRDMLAEPAWKTSITYGGLAQLKWNARLHEKYKSRDLTALVRFIKTTRI